MSKQLTGIQKETFIRSLSAGKNRTEAYLDAFPSAQNCTPGALRARASKLAKDPEVIARLDALKHQAQKQTENDFDRFLTELRGVVFEPIPSDDMRWADKLRAMELYAKILGYAEQKQEKSVEDLTPLAEMLNAND